MVDNVSPEHLSRMLQSSQQQNAEQLQQAQQLQKNADSSESQSFQQLVDQLISEVDEAQRNADESIEKLAAGDENTSIQDVVTKMQEADMAFQLMHEIRDKLVQAYKKTIKM